MTKYKKITMPNGELPDRYRYTYNSKYKQYTIRHSEPCEYGDSSAVAQILISCNPEEDEQYAEHIVNCLNNHIPLINTIENLIADWPQQDEVYEEAVRVIRNAQKGELK